MNEKVFFINTVYGMETVFNALVKKHVASQVQVTHISDQSIIQRLVKDNDVSPYVFRRLIEHAIAAEQAGAAVIQFTCSSISPIADVIQKFVSVPILIIDAPVMEQAISRYKRIGLIATNPATMKPSGKTMQRISVELKQNPEIVPKLCDGAFAALLNGETEKHDTIVKADLLALLKEVDAVVLAQASMARVADSLSPGEKIVPILSSPEPAIMYLAEFLAKRV